VPIRYSTIQNWSHNTYNLVTKRAKLRTRTPPLRVDGNLGSADDEVPGGSLGRGRCGEILSVAYADGQHQDGGKIVHAAPNTSSLITSKSTRGRAARRTAGC